MIRRVRHAAPYIISLGLMLGSGGLVAQATHAAQDPGVSRSELYATLGVAGTVVFGAFWVLLRAQNGDLKNDVAAAVGRIEGAVAMHFDAIRIHDENPHAHGAASKENHRPIFEQLEEIGEKVDSILHARRDPSDTPRHKRHGDADGEDHVEERGA